LAAIMPERPSGVLPGCVKGQTTGASRSIPQLRWWIAALLALATALNYLDRQSFPAMVGEITKAIPFTNQQYGRITSLFLLAYALMNAGGGRVLDWLGTRNGYAVMILWWSVANFLTGTVSSVVGLGFCRFLLGMGEGGGFPGSAKAVAEWFPSRERAQAFGIFNAGSSVGAIVAAPLIALIVSLLNWRWAFFITGALGFFWAGIWLKFYQPPARNKFISPAERDYIATSLAPSSGASDAKPAATVSWFRLFAFRQVWGLMLAKFLSDAAWYFFIFWLPKYLGDVRHLDIKHIGYFAWIPFLFAGTGSLLGGWLSGAFIRRGFTLDRARKMTLGLSVSLMPVSLLIAASPLSFAIVFFSIAMFAHQVWSANVQTLSADIFPANVVGSVGGLVNAAGSFGGMLFGLLVGSLVEHHGYGTAFIMAGVLHPLAFMIILLVVRRIEAILPGA
jgi:ACS family hexuronate transporter-like MFS transporter